MSARPIIDAGPSLNFLSINRERLLIAILGPLSAPETVQDEVFRKSQQDSRFRAAGTTWRKLTPRWIQILPDDATTVLGRAAGTEHLPDRAAMRDIYTRLRGLDDGLPPIEKTDLLSNALWS
jgi:hypothetical protein